MSDPAYDGLCGIPCPMPLRGGTYLRCKFEFGHGGDHSWKKHEHHSRIFGGITAEEVEERAAKGSPAAQAILNVTKPRE